MKWFFIVLALIVVVGLSLWVTAPAGATAFGMPVACYGIEEPDFCWITLGGFGVLVFGAGAGVVEIGIFGAGLLFAVGQLTVGLIAFGQVVLGPVFFCAQGGFGLVGLGQGGRGLYAIGQGRTGGEGRVFLDQLNRELNDLLRVF